MDLYHLMVSLLLFTSLETIHSLKNDQSPTKMDYIKALNQTVYVIEKLLSFYEDQINEVNLDAIYGLRVTEGALTLSLKQHDESFWKALKINHIHEKIRNLREQAGSINTRAQTSIKHQGKKYYDKFKDIVDKPWTFFRDFGYRKLPVDKVQVFTGKKSTWDEVTSDRCMSEVLGSNPNHTKCSFTPLCVNAITDQRQERYGPTHQILFLTLALMNGCQERFSDILKQHMGNDVDGLIESRCVKVMSEMIGLEQPAVKEHSRDLYMEQGFVCAIHGYEEFLSLKRLENVLSWQRTVGCFGNLNDEDDDEDEDEDEIEDNEEQTGILRVDRKKRMVGRSGRDVGSFRSMRKLLVDVSVAHGCSAHESGVAAGLLGCYAKWLLAKLNTGIEKPTVIKTKIHGTSLVVKTNIIAAHTPSPNQNNPTTSTGKHVMNARTLYIRSVIISFVTSLLTVSVVLSLYKLGEHCCTRRRSSGKYRPLIDA